MTRPGAESEQTSYGRNRYAGSAARMEESQVGIPSTILTAIPTTIPRRISKVSAKPAMIRKQAAKQDLAALMKQHGIKWGKHDNRRVLMIPCTVSEAGIKAVRDAIKNENT